MWRRHADRRRLAAEATRQAGSGARVTDLVASAALRRAHEVGPHAVGLELLREALERVHARSFEMRGERGFQSFRTS